MTTKTGANRTFLVTILAYLAFSLLWGFVTRRMDVPYYADILLSQFLVVFPSFLYMKIAGEKVKDLIPYRKIRFLDAILAVLITYLCYPLLVVINLLSMFFVENTSAQVSGMMSTQSLWVNVLLVAILPAFAEEFVFRGMLYHTYKKYSMGKAVLLSAFLFGCMHMNFNQFLYTFAFGCILAMVVEASGSILASMVCHFILNLNSVLLVDFLGRSRGNSLGGAVEESESLLGDPKLMMAGTLLWVVIAIFASLAAFGLWVLLAKRNHRLEIIRMRFCEPAKGRLMTIPLALAIVLSFAMMIFIEVLGRI